MMRCQIIAEAGVNHNGSLETAYRLIDAAIEAGADVVKFQTFVPERLVTAQAPRAEYQIANMGRGTQSQLQMLRDLSLPLDQYERLKSRCDLTGIEFLSTPFDYESADCLEPLVRRYKISSGDLTNLPFLEYLAAKAKPLILSTGMGTLAEAAEAVEAIQARQRSMTITETPLTVLHCSTEYPCRFEDVNLRAMTTMQAAFGIPVGYSDHTLGIEIPVAAVAMGAVMIEKHFTLDPNMPGPDHRASLDPGQFKVMVDAIRNCEHAFGDGIKRPAASELPLRSLVRKSIVAARDIPAEAVIDLSMLSFKRPGDGIAPGRWKDLIGLRTSRTIARDCVLKWEDFRIV
jgi:N,N'-diacetyllegionaminate synthase